MFKMNVHKYLLNLPFKAQKRGVQMLTVRVYGGYNLIALEGLDTDDFENCKFSKKFRTETIGNMEKLMACVGH